MIRRTPARSRNANQSPAPHTKALRKAQERVIELSARGAQLDASCQAHQHPPALTNLHFMLNQRHSQITSSHGDPESHNDGTPQKRTRGHHAPTRNRTGKHFPNNNKDQGWLSIRFLKLPIDQILYIIKHQPWVRLSKPSKRSLNPLEAGHCSFHDIRGHSTLHCWALKRHLEDLVQRE